MIGIREDRTKGDKRRISTVNRRENESFMLASCTCSGRRCCNDLYHLTEPRQKAQRSSRSIVKINAAVTQLTTVSPSASHAAAGLSKGKEEAGKRLHKAS